jgi:hypothetical protein
MTSGNAPAGPGRARAGPARWLRLRITFWSSSLRAAHEAHMAAVLPLWMRDSGTSIWLETV